MKDKLSVMFLAGEASGDGLAAELLLGLRSLLSQTGCPVDAFGAGGERLKNAGAEIAIDLTRHAVVGIIEVLKHFNTLKGFFLKLLDLARERQPDVVILVDYPGFNLNIAKYVKSRTNIPVYYYISPKIWAWKEYRIKNIKRDVDELFSILPFEVPFFEQKHDYPIHYVGNPTAQEVREFLSAKSQQPTANSQKPTIALLAGSRKQEIKDNLPAMIEATQHLIGDYDIVLAGAPSIPKDYYLPFLEGSSVRLVMNETYPLLSQATAALVTSGTATLETCMFRVPQVVCYNTAFAKLFGFLKRHLLSVRYVSLVNLIADREVVRELVADAFSVDAIRRELNAILPGGNQREQQLADYEEIHHRLGDSQAPDVAAQLIINLLNGHR